MMVTIEKESLFSHKGDCKGRATRQEIWENVPFCQWTVPSDRRLREPVEAIGLNTGSIWKVMLAVAKFAECISEKSVRKIYTDRILIWPVILVGCV